MNTPAAIRVRSADARKPAAQKIALVAALVLLAGCQTVGNTTRAVFHANTVETVESPGPERFWNKAGLVISPARSIAQVGTEVPVFAGICDDKGQLQPYEKVEWMLDNCSVGSLVSVNEPMRPWILDIIGPKTHKVDNNYAISETLPANVILTRGTPNINDDMVMPRGYSWVTVTSPTEGISYLTARGPDVYSWDARQKNSVIHWINAEWTFPEAGCVPPGAGAALVTCVQRRTNKTAVTDWIVKYTITGGAAAGFGADNAQSVEVATDETGKATAELLPAGNATGTTCVCVELIKPGCEADDEPERLSIATAATHVNWSTTQLTLRVVGPSEATVGSTANYRIEVANAGSVAGNDVIVQLSPLVGAAIIKSIPQADGTSPMTWRLGQIAGGEVKTISFDAQVNQAGPLRVSATLNAAEGLTAESSATTNVHSVVAAPVPPPTTTPPIATPPANVPPTTLATPPKVDIEITGPQTAKLGEDVTFKMQFINRGTVAATGLIVKDTFDRGLQRGTDQRPIERQLGDLAAGETREFSLTFRVMQPGNLCHTVELTAPGGLKIAEKQACVSVPAETPQAGQPEFSATIKASQQVYRVGDLALFNIEIVNTGAVAAKDFKATIEFGQGLQPTRATGAGQPWCKEILNGVEYTQATLRPGDRFIQQIECKCVSPTVAACADLKVADASQRPMGGQSCVQILPAAAAPGRQSGLQLKLAPMDNPVRVGSEVSFALTITNTGLNPEKMVRLSIVVPESLTYMPAVAPMKEVSNDPPNVKFEPIVEIRPTTNDQIQVRLRFRANRAGPAQVTAEVTSQNLDQPLTQAAKVDIL